MNNNNNNKKNEDNKDTLCHENVTNNPTSITSPSPPSPTTNDKNTNNTQNKNKNNKKRKNTYFKSTWNKTPKDDDDDDTTSHPNEKTKITRREINRHRSPHPHEGSFAHPLMQQLFPSTTPPPPPSSSKRPKRKVALLIAFLGTNYSGMQINKHQHTIQAALERALYHSHCLSSSNYGHPHKYSWSNAARTDKGVHSCAQVCSLKIELPEECGTEEDMDVVRRCVNECLPEDIRVLDVVKTTKSFCAKTQREKVRYQYMIPSFLFFDAERLDSLWKDTCLKHDNDNNNSSNGGGGGGGGGRLHPMGLPPTTAKHLHTTHFAPYRITPSQLTTLQTALSLFKGTHSFHNYTSRKTAADPSSQRYIHSLTVHTPLVLRSSDGAAQWIPVTVVGQSFLLHQIRKMIGMGIEVARGATTLEVLKESLTERSMVLGLAPAQGLFLDMSYYGLYNKKKVDHEDLVWHEEDEDDDEKSDNKNDDDDDQQQQEQRRKKRRSQAVKRWKTFKEEVVVTHVMEEEEREFNFVKWLLTQEFLFDRKNYLLSEKQSNDGNDDDDNAEEKGKVVKEDTTTTLPPVPSS